ncbi:hypothetical protein J6Q66_02660, partial [bacterium]|nr:hypothetical protein [bacterium]
IIKYMYYGRGELVFSQDVINLILSSDRLLKWHNTFTTLDGTIYTGFGIYFDPLLFPELRYYKNRELDHYVVVYKSGRWIDASYRSILTDYKFNDATNNPFYHDDVLQSFLIQNFNLIAETTESQSLYFLGYQEGYKDGYDSGLNSSASSSLGANLLGDTLSAPINALNSITIYQSSSGYNVTLWGILSTIIGASLFIWFLKMFAGG